MKQLFPILIAIVATTLILVMYFNKEGKEWEVLNDEEKKRRLAILTVFGVAVFVGCVILFLVV